MSIEVLIIVSTAILSAVTGYFLATLKGLRSKDEEIQRKITNLNENLANFAKAYSDFNAQKLDIDTRLTNLEFKLGGIVSK